MSSFTRNSITFFILLLLLCVSGYISFPLMGTSVPVSLQSLFVLLPAFYLKRSLAALVVFIYLLLGAIGLPVFSGGSSGVDTLLGSNVGFFTGFLLAVTALARNKVNESPLLEILIKFMGGQFLILVIGFAFLVIQHEDLSIAKSLWKFLPGLIVKSILGTLIVVVTNKIKTVKSIQ